MRSARTSGILKAAGFKQVRNMKGGILAWSDRVDSSVPKH
jgi:adenylyltransferase/sulfurtransferase